MKVTLEGDKEEICEFVNDFLEANITDIESE